MFGILLGPTSAVLALFCATLALASAWVIQVFAGKPAEHVKYKSLDGLRGFLAFFVFIHHASVWYFYSKSGNWSPPPSNLFVHFGQSSVALFFMITSFLFVTKILDAKPLGLDWKDLFVSRFFRIVPLYGFAMLALMLIVAILSKWTLREPADSLIFGVLKWGFFTVGGSPDLNKVPMTGIIVANVFWSLAYEWVFYFSLPIIGLILARNVPKFWVFSSAFTIFMLGFIWIPEIDTLKFFLGGIGAAFIARSDKFQKIAQHPISSLIALGCLVCTFQFYGDTSSIYCLFLLSVFFVFVASGADIFGLLTLPASRKLGEVSYSIYLLHGILLFVVLKFVIGADFYRSLSSAQHWLVVCAITPILVICSSITFAMIEKPCIDYAKKRRR